MKLIVKFGNSKDLWDQKYIKMVLNQLIPGVVECGSFREMKVKIDLMVQLKENLKTT